MWGGAGWGQPGPGPPPPPPPGMPGMAQMQNMPHSQVDWASLAQQWINGAMAQRSSMGGPSSMGGAGAAPPPPPPSKPRPPPPLVVPPGEEGGGEANMELEEEEGPGAVMGHGGWANQGSNNPRGWGWQGPNESGSGSQSPSDQFDHRGSPGPGQWPMQGPPKPPGLMDNTHRNPPVYPSNHPPALPSGGIGAGQFSMGGGMGGFSGLNETQKKKLPAWIRAGLEKMEMDKLKKEQEEERKRRTEEKKRLRRLEEAEEVARTKAGKDPARSKFDEGGNEGSGGE